MEKFVAYFYFNGFTHISFGIHFDWRVWNIEIHVPFGFFRVGWTKPLMPEEYKNYRAYGYSTD